MDMQDYLGGPVGTNAHVSDLVYADDIVPLNNCKKEMQGMLKAVHRHVATIGMCVHVTKAKPFVLNDQYQACSCPSEMKLLIEHFNRSNVIITFSCICCSRARRNWHNLVQA